MTSDPDPDALPCGCRWRRDETNGDVIDQCAEHRAQTERRVRGLDASLAVEADRRALRGLDRELEAVRRGRR